MQDETMNDWIRAQVTAKRAQAKRRIKSAPDNEDAQDKATPEATPTAPTMNDWIRAQAGREQGK